MSAPALFAPALIVSDLMSVYDDAPALFAPALIVSDLMSVYDEAPADFAPPKNFLQPSMRIEDAKKYQIRRGMSSTVEFIFRAAPRYGGRGRLPL